MKKLKNFTVQRLLPIVYHDFLIDNEITPKTKFKKILLLVKLFIKNSGKVFEVITDKKIAMRYVEVVVTTKCSLKCKNCSNLIQFYGGKDGIKQSYDTELKNNIKSIEKLLPFINVLAELRVLGGEPFLYKNLNEFLKFLSTQEKIKGVAVTTNGTIVPSDDVLETLKSNKKFSVTISNYGVNSRRIKELKEKLSSYGIRYKEIFINDKWLDFGGINCRNRTADELKQQYSNCGLGCKSLLNGKLFSCFRSTHLADLGIIKECSNDYVDLLNENLSASEIKSQLKNVLFGQYPLAACNYCDYGTDDAKPITPGEQL